MRNPGLAAQSVALTLGLFSLNGCGELDAAGAQQGQARGSGWKWFASKMTIPIDTGVNDAVAVEYVDAWQHGSVACINGTVRPLTLGALHPQAHVDVVVVDAGGQVQEAQTARWLPRAMPTGPHALGQRSRFAVRLQTMPSAKGKVRTLFHNASVDECHNQNRNLKNQPAKH